MERLLNLPPSLIVKRINDNLFIQIRKKPLCSCSGIFHIHRTFHKDIKIAYIVPNRTISAKVTYYYYKCQKCQRFFLDDGNLGIQHSSSHNYRHAICALIPYARSLRAVAKLTSLPISTIRGWQNQLHQQDDLS